MTYIDNDTFKAIETRNERVDFTFVVALLDGAIFTTQEEQGIEVRETRAIVTLDSAKNNNFSLHFENIEKIF